MTKLGELEATVMEHLWCAGEARSVRDILQELQQDRPIAYTTVMTVMERLYRKGVLTRVVDGRAYLYTPRQTRAGYSADLMADALATTSDKAATFVHFADRVSAGEARQLIKALSERGHRRRG